MPFNRFLLVLPILSAMTPALAGCGRADHQAPAPAESLKPLPPEQPPAPGNDECGASGLSSLLNSLPTDDVMTRIRASVGDTPIRTIRPGSAVTMDFRPDRLNIELGEDGRIKLFRCG